MNDETQTDRHYAEAHGTFRAGCQLCESAERGAVNANWVAITEAILDAAELMDGAGLTLGASNLRAALEQTE